MKRCFREKICDIIEQCFDYLYIIFKWCCFPFCLILMCLKQLKWVIKHDIPWFYHKWISSPIISYDGKLEWNSFDGGLRSLFYTSFNNTNNYLLQEIPSDYMDKVDIIRELIFTTIIDFVEKEKCFENNEYFLDYSAEEAAEYYGVSLDYIKNIQQVGREIKRLYNYAKVAKESPERIFHALKLLNKINKSLYIKIVYPDVDSKKIEENYEYYSQSPENVLNLEEQINNIVIKKIVALRMYLWI